MSEVTVVDNPTEVVIEIEGGPVLTTTVASEQQTLIETPATPVVIDLNSGARGEPGSAVLTGNYYPLGNEGTVGDVFIITGGDEPEYIGAVLEKNVNGWQVSGNIRGPVGGINSVAGQTGPDVVLSKSDVSLANVDNTTDLLKPISTATQGALDLKANTTTVNTLDGANVKLTGNQTIAGVKSFSSDLALADTRILIRGANDANHFIQWAGGVDGPRISGAGGGELGYGPNTSFTQVLRWSSTGVTVTGTLTGTGLVTAAGVTLSSGAFTGSGSGITGLNGTNISSGTVNDARLSTNVALLTGAQTFSGAKTFSSEIIGPAAGNVLKVGDDARLVDVNVQHVMGIISQVDVNQGGIRLGSSFTISANAATGTITGSVIVSTNLTVNGTITGNGSGLTTLNGSNISSGTVADARLSGNVDLINAAQTITGVKTFNVNPSVVDPVTAQHVANKKYVDDQITLLTTGAPALLNTLDELAQALGDDANFATTMTNNLATKVSLTGDQTIAGAKTFSSNLGIQTSSGASILSVTQSGAGYSSANAAINVNTENPAGTANHLFRGMLNGTSTFTVRADGLVTSSAGFSGPGGSLTALSGTAITTGTVADPRLSTNVVLATGAQTLSGLKTFSGGVAISPSAGVGRGITWTSQYASLTSVPSSFATLLGNNVVAGDTAGTIKRVGSADNGTYLQLNYSAGLSYGVITSGAGVEVADSTGQVFAVTTTGNVSFTGTITGNGSGLTALNGSNISAGTVADARLSTNVATLSGTQTFSGTKTFTGLVTSNLGFAGSGASLTSLPTASLTGTILQANLLQNVRQVVHGAVASTARPTGVTHIHWVGTVAPTNATANDIWWNA